jgi:spore germination protein
LHVSGPAVATANVRDGVSVWLPYWNMPAALDSALANAGLVGTASPFWYAISGDSTIEDDPGAGESSIIDELRGRGIRIVPTVTETEDMDDFDRMLASVPRRVAMMHALLTIAAHRDYGGLDLDFEDFAVDPPHNAAQADEAAALYPAFIAQVCGALHAIGRSCTVTVMPRTTGEHVYWRGQLATWVYDYGALAKVADRVQIMAYDEHAPGGPPGPIAPYEWVEQVISYASSAMAVEKVELALPAYGYDWSGDNATAITSRQAPQLAIQNGVSPEWNGAQAEDTFSYTADGRRHTVWYEGAMAAYDRARLAKAAGFAGIDLWAAGGEEPAVWPMLRALYAR